jgi:hypothetical protein
MPLAARPIAAQYGVYAHSGSYISATVSQAPTGGKLMIIQRGVAFAIAGAFGAVAAQAAELPSQRHTDKPARAEAAKKCDVAGSPGVLASDGVCVRLSGYVSSQFGGGQLK